MSYINGSDILLAINNKQFLHSTGHTTTYDTTTKERAVKAIESKGVSASLFKEVGVVGLSISITANGLRAYGDSADTQGTGAASIKQIWYTGKPVRVECYLRPEQGVSSDGGGGATASRKPYLIGQFVITKITEGSAAEDDATFDVELQMSGKPVVWAPENSDITISEEE